MSDPFIFYQLFEHESSTYTYLIGDRQTREAILIDPVIETIERDLKLLEEEGLKLCYTLDTHIHADHVTAAASIRKRTGSKAAVSHHSKVLCADVLMKENDELKFGSLSIRAIETPGHTDSCMSYVFEDRVFTGDALLIRGCGRTDFQQGSSEKLYHSVTQKLFKLPPFTKVYPAHDYKGQTSSTIEMEMKWNPRLGGGKTLAEFSKIMSDLKLAPPQKIEKALPFNMRCGEAA